MNELMFSIIVPMFNSEKHISKTLSTILRQTYGNFEIILVDDGSCDKTKDICLCYKKKDDRIKYIHKENSGPSSARNLGIKLSQGKYIVFCDSDDEMDLNFCKKAYDILTTHDYDFITFGICNVLINGNGDKKVYVNDTDKLLKNNLECKYYYYNHLINGYTQGPCAKVYKAKILKEHQILFNTDTNFGEDMIFNLDYIDNIEDAFNCHECLYNYIQISNNNRLTKVQRDKFNNNILMKKRIDLFSIELKNIELPRCIIEEQLYFSYVNSIINLYSRDVVLDKIRSSYKLFITCPIIVNGYGINRKIISIVLKINNSLCIYIVSKLTNFLKNKMNRIYYRLMSK